MTPTSVYESYWRFAAERHAIYLRRLCGEKTPWTQDPILQRFRFTNTFRAADRVTQYLIGQVQYRDDRSQAPNELFFRTMLFKLFNKISTWQLLERELGPISWQSSDMSELDAVLDKAINQGQRIYSAAYIMPAPQLGHKRKHTNHLHLLRSMMADSLPGRIDRARSLAEVYELLRAYPGIGSFLAFQYAIDLNYSQLLDFDEASFVVAGPGALDGIAKCFSDVGNFSPEAIIHEMVERQAHEFERLGLQFDGLFGRPLQPIDAQNLFCEISKYARVAHPEMRGTSGRVRIKQVYQMDEQPLETPEFPPRWGLSPPAAAKMTCTGAQMRFWS
jgi:hypothetical protein